MQGIISWLSWITEQESQQPSQTTLPFRPTEYMQHLQVTYEAHISRHEGPQEAMDVISPSRWNQVTPSAPSREDMAAGTEMESAGKQDEPTITAQQDHYATTPEEVIQQPQASAPQRPPTETINKAYRQLLRGRSSSMPLPV